MVSAEPEPLAWPIKGHITSGYGPRGDRNHQGIDIRAHEGRWIRSAESGFVIFSGMYGNYGNLVAIRHKGGVVTYYAHMKCDEEHWCAFKGMKVRRRQKIGRVGMTGRTTGPHLHFEVRYQRKPQDPLDWLTPTLVEDDNESTAIGGP